MTREPTIILALSVLLAGCDAISPFVGEDLKDAVCDRDVDGLARTGVYCGGTDCDDTNTEVGVLTWHVDIDQDGYGTQSTGGIVQCAPLSGYASRAGDCDDANAELNPSAAEVCDAIDNDCDEALDELDDELVDGFTRYEDIDGDSWGSDVSRIQCEEATGWVQESGDCDDADAGINPLATELCEDGIDQNCNSETDTDAVDVPWYRDADEDGYGDLSDSTMACAPPEGYVADGTDCDDGITSVNPGVEEVCNNGVDDNCDESPGVCELAGTISLSAVDANINGENIDDNSGYSVANAGDVNNDGYDDLLIGVPGETSGGNRSGSAYVVFGSIPDGEWDLSSADLKLTGEAPADEAGHSVAGVGDVNGDGVDDLAVGAPGEDSAGSGAGAVYVFYGPLAAGEISLASADLKLTGVLEADAAGTYIAGVGDVNDDGIADMATSAPYVYSNINVVYVLYGPLGSGTVSLSTASLKLTGETTGDQAGYSVASAGDVNGDDVDDLVVGAPGEDSAGSGAGAVYVFYGPLAADEISLASVDLKLTGELEGDAAGTYIAGVGDVNGDDVDDLVVSAAGASSSTGAVYVLYGPLSTGTQSLATASLKLTGETVGDQAGYRIASTSDVDADATNDLILSALNEDSGDSGAGAVYVLYGPLSMGTQSLATASLKLTGEAASDLSGCAIATLDHDGDGFTDVVVGAYQNNGGGKHSGATYLLNGLGY